MGIVDYLSRDPYSARWPESELDEKVVVATFNSFHKALDCMNSRLENICSLNRNENVLEYSTRNVAIRSSNRGCYGNHCSQKRAKPNRNEINQLSRSSKQLNSSSQTKRISFSSFQPSTQSSKKLQKQHKSQWKKIQKQIHGRRCQKETSTTTHKTGGQIHHRNGEVRTEKRTF